MAFCNQCDREVGFEKVRPTLSTILLVILGLIVPLWPITLPFFWALAVLNYTMRAKKVCGICKASKKEMRLVAPSA